MRLNGVDKTLSVATGANNGDWFGDCTLLDNVTIGGAKWNAEAQFGVYDLALLGVAEGVEISVDEQTALETYVQARFGNFS